MKLVDAKKVALSMFVWTGSLDSAEDGIHFDVLLRDLKNMPAAPGLYRPELIAPDRVGLLPEWGISMAYRQPHLLGFECLWTK